MVRLTFITITGTKKVVDVGLDTPVSDLYRMASIIVNNEKAPTSSLLYPEHLKLVANGSELENNTNPLSDFTKDTDVNIRIMLKLRAGPNSNSMKSEQKRLTAKYSSNIEKSKTKNLRTALGLNGGKRKTRRTTRRNRKTLRRR